MKLQHEFWNSIESVIKSFSFSLPPIKAIRSTQFKLRFRRGAEKMKIVAYETDHFPNGHY